MPTPRRRTPVITYGRSRNRPFLVVMGSLLARPEPRSPKSTKRNSACDKIDRLCSTRYASRGRPSTISSTSTSSLPRNKLIVVTGPSGSGKSSLAFDTIFAEGQRRYIECLSAYARQFIDQMEKPDGRVHRRHLAGHLHRPEDDLDQSALDRGHDHRGLRPLPAPLRPRRDAPLPELRPDRQLPDAGGDREEDRRERFRREGPHPGPRDQGAQRRIPAPFRAPSEKGFPPGPRQRCASRPRGRHPAREEPQAHDRGPRRRDPDRPRRRAAPRRGRRQGPRSVGGRSPRRRRRGPGALLLPDPSMPLLRGQPGRARAPQLFLQQSLRRLPELPRARPRNDPQRVGRDRADR